LADLFAISEVPSIVQQHAIFVHGLGGDAYSTWRSLNDPAVYWPQWLSKDIPGLAVWTIGYEAAVSRWRGSAMHLTDRAQNVLVRILAEPRLQTGEITLIGHSLGGLVIKQLLRTADSMAFHDGQASDFVKRVRRVAFLATPHSGSGLASWGDRLRIIIRPSATTASLVRNDPNLRELNVWYRNWTTAHKIDHLIITENKSIGLLGLIVSADSSDPGLSVQPICVDADHITICKPADCTSEVYVHVRNFISRPLEIAHRETVVEYALKAQSAHLEALTQATQEGVSQLTKIHGTTETIADRLNEVVSSSRYYPKELVDNEIQKNISIIRRARFFVGFSASDHSLRLGEKILNGDLAGGSDAVKSRALAWCSRFLATGKETAKFDEFLSRARELGSGPEILVAEAFRISAGGNLDGALSMLAKLQSPTARSAAFQIVTQQKKATYALDWLSRSGVQQSDLDADGKFFLINNLFELGHWDAALQATFGLEQNDFQSAPVLFYSAAMSHLAQAIPDELKSRVLQQVPFDASSFPLASTEASLKSRTRAQEFFQLCAIAAEELGCIEVSNIMQDYALWLELRDPEGHLMGRQKLEISMRDPTHSLRRLHLALQFGLRLDLNAVEQEIERQTTITGGRSRIAAMARFALAFTRKNPKDVADYIDRHRTQLFQYLENKSLGILEIELLARAGLPQRAEERLTNLVEEGLSDAEKNQLHRMIADSTENDSAEARMAQFESSGEFADLVNLVSLLEKANDWSQLCHYGSLLFAKTQALSDAERLAHALDKANRHLDLISLLRKFPDLLNQSDNLQMLWSWSLYREGLLAESKSAVEKLRRTRDHPSDRALLINLAVASGAWETLLPYLEIEWTKMEQRQSHELIQTASLAQIMESPRTKDLVKTAADKGNSNPAILIGAYTIATRGGWENEPTVAEWLHRAANLSDDSGPLQKVSLKDLLDRAPEWNRREADAWKHLNDGALPIFGVARLLNRTLVDMFLLPALANPGEPDPRKRALIPAYSGVRQPFPYNFRVIAIDATALLTLGVLGLLEAINKQFDTLFIPHSTLAWLFEEKQKVTFHQPSRIKGAAALRGLLATGALKTFSRTARIDADLIAEVGEELASLIAESFVDEMGDGRQRLVIRPSPVHRVNSLMQEEADLSRYSSHLSSCIALVDALKQRGQLTATEESRARSYLSLHEKEWPHQPAIPENALLYLDDLAVSYLQHTDLLIKLRSAGFEVYVSPRKLDEINGLLRYEELASEIERVIDTIRKYLAAGIQIGKIKVGAMPHLDETEDPSPEHHPTFAIVQLAKHVEAIVVDDRFLNQHGHFANGSSQVPILTTLDILAGLCSSNNIDFDQWLEYRTNLRRANYLFLPMTSAEIEHHLSVADVVDGRLVETAELKAIRENLLRIRMSNFLQLPKEAPWLSGVIQTFTDALKAQWQKAQSITATRARSDWLAELLDLRGWAHCFVADGGMRAIEQGHVAQIMSLLCAPQDFTAETEERYWEWVEERFLNKIREEESDIYSLVIERTKELISHVAETDIAEESK
jgi:hypothetical protein